jgi:RNA polymerase sigma-70 factor (ECF subfamily)
MATHRTANYLRTLARNTRLVKNVAGQMIVEKNTTEEAIDVKEMQEMINIAVEQLPEQQKKVYKLSRKEGLTAEEIAAQMNLSHKTVKNHLTEALHFIKEKLQHSPGAAIALIIFLMKNAR